MLRACLLATMLVARAAAGQPQHPEGDYCGVVPGQAQKSDQGCRPHKPLPKGTLSWMGFSSKDGTTELFFQSAAAFEVAQRLDNGTLVVQLTGVTKLGANTWRPIDTRYFDGPIARVTTRAVGATKGKNAHPAGVEVRVTFKDPKAAAEATLRTATESDGLFYAYLTWAAAAAEPSVQDPEK
jgi:hypothetical protein